MEKDRRSPSNNPSTDIVYTWNDAEESLLKAISERSNCMRWLHTQCQNYFEYMNFYLTIPNVIISTLNGSFTMSLNSLFPEASEQKVATTIIGLISIFSAVLITMNQYLKSQQMMEAHRASGLAYGKLHRVISNELAMRRDQRTNAFEFLKYVRNEQDRLENISPSILPSIITKFNREFANRDIEKPEIAGDLDQVAINRETGVVSVIKKTMSFVVGKSRAYISPSPIRESDLEEALQNAAKVNNSRKRKNLSKIAVIQENESNESGSTIISSPQEY